MSIDHGKLLALLSEVLPPRPLPGSIDSGSACSFTMSPLEIEHMHIRFDMLNSALAQPAEAVQCIWPDCGHDTNQSDQSPGCNGKFCPKPAEAAEDITDLVMQPGAACPTCKQFLHVQPAEAVEDDHWSMAAQAAVSHLDYETDAPQAVKAALRQLSAALNGTPTNDAAQGAVAPFAYGADLTPGDYDMEHSVWLLRPGESVPAGCTPLYTHPQDAPAQGGVSCNDPMCDQVMRERDQAEEIIDKLCDTVLGTERAEWSSSYFFEDAVEDVKDELHRLRKQAAPAQGDGMVLVPVNATEEMRSAFAIAMGDTRILGAKEQFRIAYAKLLAAAPSQEGES